MEFIEEFFNLHPPNHQHTDTHTHPGEGGGGGTYILMFPPILIRHRLARPRGYVLLKRGVHDELLGDGVARERPDELVLPARGGVGVGGGVAAHDVVVVGFEVAVVALDGGG